MNAVRGRWTGLLIVCVGCSRPNPAFQPNFTGGGSDSGGASEATSEGSSTSEGASLSEGSSSGTTDAPTSTGDDTTTTATTTGSSTGTSGELTTGTTGDPPLCGNGFVDLGEQCDGGPAVVLEPGKCKPDCSGEIEKRLIFVTPEQIMGGFASGAGITVADDLCAEAGAALGLVGAFKAMISDDGRYASTTPYAGDCSADWPLQPYTAYMNFEDQLVWVTSEVRLLGVVAGQKPGEPNVPAPLLAPIDAGSNEGVWTGLMSTWETGTTCMNWQGGLELGIVGDVSLVEKFLDAYDDQVCAADYRLICVEL